MTETSPAPLILQDRLAVTPWMHPQLKRLPGIMPVACEDWLLQDEAYAAQMALRDELIATRRDDVFAMRPEAEAGAVELLAILAEELPQTPGYRRKGSKICRPDGACLDLDDDHPLVIAGRLVQEDLCLLTIQDGRPILNGGMMCFPAYWTLTEKIGRPLRDIHTPVDHYSDLVSQRVDRVIANIRPDAPLMRANFLVYTNPALYQPASEYSERPHDPEAPRYVRVERQTLRRLPETGTVVFAIHTHLVRASDLPAEDFVALARLRPKVLPANRATGEPPDTQSPERPPAPDR